MPDLLGIIFSTDFAYSVLRVTTPILFAAMAAVVANTAGTPNIALEGIMLFSAFVGVVVSAFTASAWAGLLGAVVFGILLAAVLAFFTLYYKTNVILGGIALNLFSSGGTIFFLYLFTHDKGTSASLPSKVLPQVDIPLIKDIPILGDIFSGHNVLTYCAILSIIVVALMMRRTSFGFKLRAVGENPQAATSVGIHVNRTRVIALLISGLLAGMGGAFMSMGYVSWFSRDMVAGRGWTAIAAEAMGRSSPIGTAATSFLFGFADALSNALGIYSVPSEFIRIIPYAATLIGLVAYSISVSRKKNPLRKMKKA